MKYAYKGAVEYELRRDHYVGPLTRRALLAALDDKQRHLLAALETVDIDTPIAQLARVMGVVNLD